MNTRTGRKHRILVVEDNPGDARLLMEAFEEVNADLEIQWARDGDEAVRVLKMNEANPSERPIDLVLLDLKLPRMDGLDVLREVKSNGHLRSVPIVILSSSMSDRDIETSYGLYANSYVVKPSDLDGLLRMVSTINDYWFGIVELPTSSTLDAGARR
ncbi:MAG TPA: response regulator [Methanomassiliicoccales archaeon]|jgi:CheY-like chemotaxis protein|nr:response regulator [Methanomassiliicoccales archaeon]